MKKISIIVPCFNEEENIKLFYTEIKKTIYSIKNLEFEIIFIDDGSSDRTYENIRKLNAKDQRVRGISFSKNFGKEAAIMAGLKSCCGDCAVVIDADLQHPIPLISEMYKLWLEGYQIVKGIKKNRNNESKFNIVTSKLFNKIMKHHAKLDMKDSSDFNLIDRKVIDVITSISEYNSFYRALIYWVGFKTTDVYFTVSRRNANKSKWSFSKRINYSVKNIIQYTYFPIKIIEIIGILIFLIGIILGIDALISYFGGEAASGYTTLLLFLILATGGIMISLGILGMYIAQIYDEIKHRPKFIIKDEIKN